MLRDRIRSGLRLALLASIGLMGCADGNRGVSDEPPLDAGAACESIDRPLPIPFEYTLASDRLEVTTAGGPLAVMLGPFGAHVQPHTGHPEGNVKADWYGLYTPTRASPGLVEVAYGTGDVVPGGCDEGARCAVLESELLARRPSYRFPNDPVSVVRVELLSVNSNDPLDGLAWEVEVELCPYRYVLGHVGGIPDELAEASVAKGGSDPRVAPMTGIDYVAGLALDVPAGTDLAYPQIRSRVIEDNPLYRTGIDSVPDVPWAQIEWTAIDQRTSEDGIAHAEYDRMDPSLRASLASILDAQVLSDDFRYPSVPHWLWAAEHVLVATPPFSRSVQSGIADGLGGWFQRPESGTCDPRPYDDANCAETFAIFPIHVEGTFYDPKDYQSDDARYLVYRGRAAGGAEDFVSFGEVVAPSVPNPISGSMLVLWRHAYSAEYQRIGYRLDATTGRLRFRYGVRVDAASVTDPETVPVVSIPGISDPCTADSLICMTAAQYGRF